MNRTIYTTLAITCTTCAIALVAQHSLNRDIETKIDTATEEVRRLEISTESRVGQSGAAIAPQTEAAQATGTQTATESSAERIDRTRSNLLSFCESIGEFSDPTAMFRALPDLLRLVQDLSVEELVQVAENIDAPLTMNGNPKPTGFARVLILLLAADQDPARVMKVPGVLNDQQIRQSVIGSLARRDAAAALEYLEKTDVGKMERGNLLRSLIPHLMRTDIPAALELLAENDFSVGEGPGPAVITVPAEAVANLVAASENPEFAEMRPQIAGMILSTNLVREGVTATRQQAEEFGFGPQELDSFFADVRTMNVSEYSPFVDWIAEDGSPATQAKMLPQVLNSWAQTDSNAAAEWIGKMEPSPTKDESLRRFAHSVKSIDAEAATIWANEIQDDTMRARGVRSAAREWLKKDPEAAGEWLKRNEIDLDAE